MGRCRSIVFVCLWLLSLPAAAELSFIQPLGTSLVSTTTGTGVIGIARGDFDRDGIVDLAVTRFEGVSTGGQQGFVTVMRGKGDGTFEAPVTLLTLPVNVFAIGILARDFDGDGKLDLAVAVYPSHQILFFKGHGDGTFDAPVATNTTHQPQGLQAADLNGDGKLDLVSSNPADNSVSVLLNVNVQTTGIFEPPTNYSVGTNPLDVALGDVDGLHGPDIVVGNNGSATVGVLLNNGDGTFGPMASFSARLRPLGLYLADFDGDGKLDVVAGGNECNSPPATIGGGGCMVFMKGQGNGTFAVPTDANFTGLDAPPTAHLWSENVALDVDGDGKPDVLFIPSQSGGFGKSTVAIGLNTGDGTGRFHMSYWVGGSAQPDPTANPDFVQGAAAVLADFDGDGVLDVAYASQGKDNTHGGVSILLGDKSGMFDVPRSYSTFTQDFGGDGEPTSRGVVFGDFTKDGKVDFAVLASGGCPENSPLIDVFPGHGDGSFGDPIAAAAIPSCHGGNHTLRSADLAQSGTLDLVFLGFNNNVGQNHGVVASGNGDGTFTLFSSFGLTAGGLNMVLGDFNGDGFPDVAVLESFGCFPPNRASIEIFLQGAGNKTFASKSTVQVVGDCLPNLGSAGIGLVAADFDGDGKLDLIASTVNGGIYSAVFFKGNGDGTFHDGVAIGPGLAIGRDGMRDYTAADVNGDRKLDLIAVGNGGVVVQFGNGDGTFQAPVFYAWPDACCGVRVADFDGDGIPDIAVVGTSGFAGFGVLRGKGDGTFEDAVKFAAGATGTNWLDVADVNGDGLPDVVVGHGGQNGNNFTVLINNSLIIADLAIAKTDSPDPVSVGRNLTYTITVTNNGPYKATGVTMTDPLPGGVTWVSTNMTQGTCSGTTTVICNLGSLANGASATVTIVVTPNAYGTGTLSNTATVAGIEFDNDLSNNSATQTTTVTSADLSITKTDSPDPVTLGANLSYTITVANAGPSGATGVTVTDPLPASVTFVSATPSQGTCSGTLTVTCALGSIAKNGSATVTIVVKPTVAGPISNTASVSANESDPDTSNNSATESTTVNAPARQLTALSPAKLWVGQNGSNRALKYDVMAEVLVNGATVGTGTLSNVKAGGSAFGKAFLDTVALALNASTAVPSGATFSIRASVRVSCSTTGSSISGIARLWYNGQPIDTGRRKDAGSRFDATIGGTNSNYFLRSALALATTPGSSMQFVDIAVNSSVACPGRPFTPFGTWGMSLP